MGAGSLLGAATAANAFTAAECDGEFEAGYWNYTDGYCEVGFGTAGEHSWTTPAKYSELVAMLVGGGGGASAILSDVSWDTGYAGGGGDVVFVDLTEFDPGTELDVFVGGGGVSTTDGSLAADGEDSWLETGSSRWEASGGLGNDDFSWTWGWCGAGFVGQGPSYFDDGLPMPADEFCGPGAPGYLPSEESDAPQIFDDIIVEVAPGGDVVSSGSGNQVEGAGADVFVAGPLEASTDDAGEHGLIVFRWIPSDLASTGVDAAPLGIAAAGMLVAGGVGLAIARRSRRSQ